MLLLTLSTDSFQLVTSAAATIDVAAVLAQTLTGAQTFARQLTAITTAATTEIVTAPTGGKITNLKALHVTNKHATLACDVTLLFNANATLFQISPKFTLQPGESLEFIEGIGFFKIANTTAGDVLFKVLAADQTGTNVATAQPWFTTNSGVTVQGDSTYLMEGQLALTRVAGTTSHTTGILFAGTATLTGIQYVAQCNVGDVDTLLPDSHVLARVATNTTVKAASVSATEAAHIDLLGVVRINAAGTFIPQFIYSAAPGGVPTIRANSFFRLTRLGSGSVVTQGAWS